MSDEVFDLTGKPATMTVKVMRDGKAATIHVIEPTKALVDALDDLDPKKHPDDFSGLVYALCARALSRNEEGAAFEAEELAESMPYSAAQRFVGAYRAFAVECLTSVPKN